MRVSLQFTPGYVQVQLRELTGRDELELNEPGVRGALRLLDTLVTAWEGAVLPKPVATLATADRDRLMAAVYRETYGPVVSSILSCPGCSEKFELDFSVDNIITFLQPDNSIDGRKKKNVICMAWV